MSRTQRIQVGNGQFVSVLFIIPTIIDIHGHRFEIYALVSEIHENVDLVLGIKNIPLVNLLDKIACSIMMIELKFIWNLATLDVTNIRYNYI